MVAHVPKHESTSLEQATHVPKHEPEQVEQVVSTSLEQATHVPKHEPMQVEQVVSTSLERSTHVPKHEPEQVEQVVSTSLEQSTHVPKHEPEQVEKVVSTSLEQSTHVPKHEPEQVEQVVSTCLEQSTHVPKHEPEQVEQVVSTSLEQALPSKEPSVVAHVPKQELQQLVSGPVLHTPGKRPRSPSPTPVKVVASCFRRLRQKTAVEITLPADCHKELDQLVERHGNAGQGNPLQHRASAQALHLRGNETHSDMGDKVDRQGRKESDRYNLLPLQEGFFSFGEPTKPCHFGQLAPNHDISSPQVQAGSAGLKGCR